MIAVKFCRLYDADLPLPAYATDGSSGMDLRTNEGGWIGAGQRRVCPTGLSVEIPRGYEGQIRPRSGLARDHCVTVLNAPGTIDSDYRGELIVLLINHGIEPFEIRRGDRIAQLVIAPVTRASIEVSAVLSGTDRGAGGFGSTGS